MPLSRPSASRSSTIEQREAAAARRVALGPRQRERHLRGDGRGEPLGAVEPPAVAVARRASSERPTSEPPVRSVIHWPLVQIVGGIARGEVRQRALDRRAVAGLEQRARGAVGHGERAGVDVGGRVEEVDERELVDARVRAEPALVGGRDQARGAPRAARPRHSGETSTGRCGCPTRPTA